MRGALLPADEMSKILTYRLNAHANVWKDKQCGRQLIKTGLSYRERSILDWRLVPEGILHVADRVKRIAGILLTTI